VINALHLDFVVHFRRRHTIVSKKSRYLDRPTTETWRLVEGHAMDCWFGNEGKG